MLSTLLAVDSRSWVFPYGKDDPDRIHQTGIPVLAYNGDIIESPTLKTIPLRHFYVDKYERPIGLQGPRVIISIPKSIALTLSTMSLNRSDEVSNPLDYPVPDGDGRFANAGDNTSVAMGTAFVTATTVIDLVELWSGHRVEWGHNGQLELVVGAFAPEFSCSYYDDKDRAVYLGALRRHVQRRRVRRTSGILPTSISAEDLILDGARSPDIVAHEAMHAALAALKPGHRGGMAIALGEGLADAMTFLVALSDPLVVQRVLYQTGGDLHTDNEASLFREVVERPSKRGAIAERNDSEPAWRSMLAIVTPADCRIDRNLIDISPIATLSSGPGGPHVIGQIISGALYELFVSIFERGFGVNLPIEEAVERAKNITGVLMVNALRFVGENTVSLREYALALLRSDQYIYGADHHDLLIAALSRRGLIDPGEDIGVEILRIEGNVPDFTIDPSIGSQKEILRRIEHLEAVQLAIVETIDWAKRDERETIPLVRHRATAFIIEEIKPDEISVFEDVIAHDGTRIVRLRYILAGEPIGGGAAESNPWADWSDPQLPPKLTNSENREGFASLIFDDDGALIAINVDRPAESWLAR